MVAVSYKRRCDLDPLSVARRESHARIFKPGWDMTLKYLGYIRELVLGDGTIIWMVDSRSSALELGCSPKSVEKNLEVLRHMRYIPSILKNVPLYYGYTAKFREPDVDPYMLPHCISEDLEQPII